VRAAYRDGEEALRAQLDDLSWQRDVLRDKRAEADRELLRVEHEIAALEARLTARPLAERGWLWALAVPFGVVGLAWVSFQLLTTRYHRRPRAERAKIEAESVRQAAELFVNTEDVESCPSVEQLVAAKKIDAQRTDDPWGRPYHVACMVDEIRVSSAGKDGRFNTPDDIRDDFRPSDMKRVAELNE
jgi:hypothetical protein